MPDEKNKNKSRDDKMTPEEKLFKVIATGGKDYPSEDAEGPDHFEQDPFSLVEKRWQKFKDFVSRGLPGRMREWFDRPVPARTFQAPSARAVMLPHVIQLKTVNQTLMVVIGLLICYMIYDLFFGTGYRRSVFTDAPSGAAEALQVAAAPEPAHDVSHYLSPAETRNVFLPPSPKPASQGGVGETSVAPPTNLKLVGISWDAKGFVAMIELEGETGAKFVRKGESLANGVRVKDITEFAVTLSLNGQEWDLT